MTLVLTPGLYPARITGFDFAKGEDYMSAAFAVMARDGTVTIEHSFSIERGSSKMSAAIHGLYDMCHSTLAVTRSRHKRHHKAKAQPNCGPRANNPW